jgi:hypothetical protein
MNAYTIEDISDIWNKINEKDYSKLNSKRKSKKNRAKDESLQKSKIEKAKENESNAEKKQDNKSGDVIQNPFDDSKVSLKDQEPKESDYPAQISKESSEAEEYILVMKLKPNIGIPNHTR